MGLREVMEKIRERRARAAQYADDVRIQERTAEKKLSSNEREWLAIKEKERQRAITEALKEYRQRETRANWTENTTLSKKNIFKGHRPILQDKPLFTNDASKSMLNQKGMFMR